MRLTTFSDYAFRVLIYVASMPEDSATIGDIAQAYGISQNHLTKVVHRLGRLGYLQTVRGKGGGLRLAKPAGSIGVGEVLRATEDGFALVECMSEGSSDCRIERSCALKGALGEALAGFLAVLDRYTLDDLARRGAPFAKVLFLPRPQVVAVRAKRNAVS